MCHEDSVCFFTIISTYIHIYTWHPRVHVKYVAKAGDTMYIRTAHFASVSFILGKETRSQASPFSVWRAGKPSRRTLLSTFLVVLCRIFSGNCLGNSCLQCVYVCVCVCSLSFCLCVFYISIVIFLV